LAISREEIQTLSILDAIEDNSRATQRELSEVTGLNLAKVNFLLRRLAEKGQLKLRNISKNPNKLKYLYILTPGGLAEKSRLTLRFAKRTLLAYAKAQEDLRGRLLRLKETGAQKILLLGAGEVTDMVLEAVRSVDGMEVVGIVAEASTGKNRRGVPIIQAVDGIAYDRAIVCDDLEIHSKALVTRAGVAKEKLWLM
jgi:DNA-binding Lrp family transcriptional regulator